MNRRILYVLMFAVACALTKGCVPYGQQRYMPPPPPYTSGGYNPNQAMAQQSAPQPMGAPFGSTVMSPYGVAIPRIAPVPNAFAGASPQAAAWRAAGDRVAQSDYAVVASGAPQAPGSMQQGGNPQNGGQTTSGDTNGDIQVLAGQQVQLNQRVRVMERMHHINPTH